MKIFGRYLGYRLEKSLPGTLIFAIATLAISFVTVSDGIGRPRLENNESSLYILAIILGGLCTLIPILELSDFKNRRNLDTLYVFPINRWKMALVHYVSGLIQVVAVYSLCFFSSWAYLELKTDYFALGYMFFYYILSLLVGIAIYSIFCFLFMQGNTVMDGILFCFLWIFVLYFVGWTIRADLLKQFLDDMGYWESSANFATDWGLIYSPLNNLTVIFQDLTETNKQALEHYYRDAYAARYMREAYMFFVWGALGLAAAAGYFITFIKKGAEKTGEISDSWFGYRILIPAYGYSLLLMFDMGDMIMTVLIFALMIGGYVTYRRGFKFKPSDIIVTGCGVLAVLLGVLL